MRIREPASLYRTKSDDEPGNLGECCPVTPEISAPLSPYNTAPMNRFGHYELRFDQMPQPITEDLDSHRHSLWVRGGLSRILPVSCSSPWSTISQRRPSSPAWP
jgi:hypothetical protein